MSPVRRRCWSRTAARSPSASSAAATRWASPPSRSYSDADRAALHVRLADEAVRDRAAAPRRESYLRMRRDRSRSRRSAGATPIHPGYGFLSENATLRARRSTTPGSRGSARRRRAIDAMGSKTGGRAHDGARPASRSSRARREPLDDLAEATARRGRGRLPGHAQGRGRRRRQGDAPRRPGRGSRRRARAARDPRRRSSFGDDTVYVEKLVERPRHVEIQVLGDAHGTVVHLFERDCSIQRRHQKVRRGDAVPGAAGRRRAQTMAEVAVSAAKAVGYVGAGTCEFLLRASDRRLLLPRDEHPAPGRAPDHRDGHRRRSRAGAAPHRGRRAALVHARTISSQRGHAIECRIYAEDRVATDSGRRPARIARLPRARGPVGAGRRRRRTRACEVPIHYDPMIAKLVVWGADRDEAIARARRALQRLPRGRRAAPRSRSSSRSSTTRSSCPARYDTGFITPEWLDAHLGDAPASDDVVARRGRGGVRTRRSRTPAGGDGRRLGLEAPTVAGRGPTRDGRRDRRGSHRPGRGHRGPRWRVPRVAGDGGPPRRIDAGRLGARRVVARRRRHRRTVAVHRRRGRSSTAQVDGHGLVGTVVDPRAQGARRARRRQRGRGPHADAGRVVRVLVKGRRRRDEGSGRWSSSRR